MYNQRFKGGDITHSTAKGGDKVRNTTQVLLADWYNHQANVHSLTNVIITLTNHNQTIANVLSNLKDEIEFAHEQWCDLRAIGITTEEDAFKAIFTLKEES